MRLDRRRLNWGIFFIAVGAVPLAANQNLISVAGLADALRLWPLFLVALGLAIVLARTPAHVVGGMLVAACLGLIVGGLFTAGPRTGCGGSSTGPMASQHGTFDGAAAVDLHFVCGTASVGTTPGSDWQLTAPAADGVAAGVSANPGSLTLEPPGGGWWLNGNAASWQVTLPTGRQLGLSISLDAGDGRFELAGANVSGASFSINAATAHIDLTGATVGSLSVSTNAATTYVSLDPSSDISGDLSTNVGTVNVCAPAGLGLRIRSNESLAGSNLAAAGLVQVGDGWQSPDFTTAGHRASLTASTNLGSLSLNPAGGCK